MSNIWNLLSKKTKFFVVSISLILIAFLVVLGQKAYYKNKYINELSARINELENDILNIENKQNEIVNDSKQKAITSAKKVKEITDKQKKDEADIDNTIITDNELAEYIAELERKSIEKE